MALILFRTGLVLQGYFWKAEREEEEFLDHNVFTEVAAPEQQDHRWWKDGVDEWQSNFAILYDSVAHQCKSSKP